VGPDVEHILVLDGVQNVKSLKVLKRLVSSFGATLVVNDDRAGISAASNKAVESASGEFLVFLDQDDFLEEGWWRPLLVGLENADFVYSDSFHANLAGHPTSIQRKPDWSPTRLIFNMYATHFMAVRKTIFEQVGGFRSEFDGSQDHDLALRVSQKTSRFKHIPIPLYSWRQSKASSLTNPDNKDWAYDAGAACAKDYLKCIGITAAVERVKDFHPGAMRAEFEERQSPVSVVVPTAFSSDLSGRLWVEKMCESLVPFLRAELGDEIVFVHGGEFDSGFLSRAHQLSGLSIKSVQDDSPFSFSRRSNIGFAIAENEHVLLLNDDVEFGDANPFPSLFGLLGLPNVGLVGGLLTFGDFSIQHAGHQFVNSLPGHVSYEARSMNHGLFDLIVDREVVGVTGALMFQLKSTWWSVGGFSVTLPLSFNDVDYCQKIRSLGYLIIQANSVTAVHHESSTREPISESWEIAQMTSRWSDAMAHDGYSAPYRRLSN
jgi:GT2 family glycosyltransferase